MVHMRAHKHQFAYTCILFAPPGDHLGHLLYTKGGWWLYINTLWINLSHGVGMVYIIRLQDTAQSFPNLISLPSVQSSGFCSNL